MTLQVRRWKKKKKGSGSNSIKKQTLLGRFRVPGGGRGVGRVWCRNTATIQSDPEHREAPNSQWTQSR